MQPKNDNRSKRPSNRQEYRPALGATPFFVSLHTLSSSLTHSLYFTYLVNGMCTSVSLQPPQRFPCTLLLLPCTKRSCLLRTTNHQPVFLPSTGMDPNRRASNCTPNPTYSITSIFDSFICASVPLYTSRASKKRSFQCPSPHLRYHDPNHVTARLSPPVAPDLAQLCPSFLPHKNFFSPTRTRCVITALHLIPTSTTLPPMTEWIATHPLVQPFSRAQKQQAKTKTIEFTSFTSVQLVGTKNVDTMKDTKPCQADLNISLKYLFNNGLYFPIVSTELFHIARADSLVRRTELSCVTL